MNYDHYYKLASVFDFPRDDYRSHVERAIVCIKDNYPDAAVDLSEFLEGIPLEILACQELYTRTFDVQSITTLDVGYVLFGDDYKRAELLSNLTRTHVLGGTDRKGELADHLPNILRLMPKFNDLSGEDLLGELVTEIMVPGLMLMIKEFDVNRIEKKNTQYEKHFKTVIDPAPGRNPRIYKQALSALLSVLKIDFQAADVIEKLESWSRNPKTVDFLGKVAQEMEIEENANPVNSGCDS